MRIDFLVVCINHSCAAPSIALALLLALIEIAGLPGCSVASQQHTGLFCSPAPAISSSRQAVFR